MRPCNQTLFSNYIVWKSPKNQIIICVPTVKGKLHSLFDLNVTESIYVYQGKGMMSVCTHPLFDFEVCLQYIEEGQRGFWVVKCADLWVVDVCTPPRLSLLKGNDLLKNKLTCRRKLTDFAQNIYFPGKPRQHPFPKIPDMFYIIWMNLDNPSRPLFIPREHERKMIPDNCEMTQFWSSSFLLGLDIQSSIKPWNQSSHEHKATLIWREEWWLDGSTVNTGCHHMPPWSSWPLAIYSPVTTSDDPFVTAMAPYFVRWLGCCLLILGQAIWVQGMGKYCSMSRAIIVEICSPIRHWEVTDVTTAMAM